MIGARPAIEVAAMRRVTWRIVPFLMVCYFVSFVDRVNAGFAALEMNQDLHLSASAFGLGGGLFFVSYFVCEVPSNLALEKIGARRWIARIMITWGIVAAAMALVVGPKSFYAVRLLLGAAEAGFFPGVILYLTYWFPAQYRARIVALFMVAVPISALIGSPISAALLGTDGWFGLRGWQWMFILEGVPAVVLGFLCFWVLPDSPARAAWLTVPEREWLESRLGDDRARAAPVGHQSLWRVLTNRQVLALAFVLAGSTATSSGLQLWQPQILKSFGLTNMQTGLVNAIPYGLAAIAMIWWGRRSDRGGERRWHAAIPLMLIAIGFAAIFMVHALAPTILLLCVAVIGIYAGKGPVWAISTEWLAPSIAAAGLAQINALSNLAGFATVYLLGVLKDATGSFAIALSPLVALSGAAAAIMVLSGRRQAAASART